MYDVGSLYVKNDQDELIKVLSRKDLLRFAISNAAPENTCSDDHDSHAKHRDHHTRRNDFDGWYVVSDMKSIPLPVVDPQEPKVIGKITKTRLMNYFIQAGNDSDNTHF